MASISTIRRRLPGLCTVSTPRRFLSASVRKEASTLIVEIVARVNAAQRLIPSAELEGAVTALMGVISQYRLVASQHTAKREKPEPGPEAAS